MDPDEYHPNDYSDISKNYTNEIKIKKFKKSIEEKHAEVHYCNENNWYDILSLIIKEKKIKSMIYGKRSDLGNKLLENFEHKSIDNFDLVDYDKPIEDIKSLLFKMDSSITFARGGIAETGTLIIWPSPEEPRLMSLVTPIHIAILHAKTIHNNFLEVMKKEKWNKNMPTNLILISGPSKTADIEQTLVYGVHGCKELVVLLIK
tara:strand:- start:743 stop:1354 length:612 start_codon:yes stop_codon:yes gene_type:complete